MHIHVTVQVDLDLPSADPFPHAELVFRRIADSLAALQDVLKTPDAVAPVGFIPGAEQLVRQLADSVLATKDVLEKSVKPAPPNPTPRRCLGCGRVEEFRPDLPCAYCGAGVE